LHEARAHALKAESDARAAQAAVESAQAELEHYVVTALIDGVVSRLEVHPGTVSRPGTSVWGEIVDVRELDVRCELPPAGADALALGQNVQITMDSAGDRRWQGKVVFISPEADKHTGLVPVLVRMANPDCRIRANVAVKVRFAGSGANQK
jgi:membrane fusion protein (multidrug efflux system)